MSYFKRVSTGSGESLARLLQKSVPFRLEHRLLSHDYHPRSLAPTESKALWGPEGKHPFVGVGDFHQSRFYHKLYIRHIPYSGYNERSTTLLSDKYVSF